jgi:hypothetical protein
MRRPRTIAALAFALTFGATLPAVAFQEIAVPPPSPSDAPAPEGKPPALALGTPSSANPGPSESGGINIFGYALLPKLDFGLELLYGQDQHLELDQGLTTFDADSDVTVFGKVKRRF